jgi:hypothetical protein
MAEKNFNGFGPSLECPMLRAKSMEGIISYLASRDDQNPAMSGTLSITSKSIFNGDARQLANMRDNSGFWSEDAPDQWVCWDFGEMRVLPTHYTITGLWLQSWVLEGSLDATDWFEIDRQTDNTDFHNRNIASFAVQDPGECRLIRLTQRSTCQSGWHRLTLDAVEFFGTLRE